MYLRAPQFSPANLLDSLSHNTAANQLHLSKTAPRPPDSRSSDDIHTSGAGSAPPRHGVASRQRPVWPSRATKHVSANHLRHNNKPQHTTSTATSE